MMVSIDCLSTCQDLELPRRQAAGPASGKLLGLPIGIVEVRLTEVTGATLTVGETIPRVGSQTD